MGNYSGRPSSSVTCPNPDQRLLYERHRETQGAGEGEGRLQGGGRVARMREEEVGAGEGEKMNYNQYLYMVDNFRIKHDIINNIMLTSQSFRLWIVAII